MGDQHPAHIVVDFATRAEQHDRCARIVTDPEVQVFHRHLAIRYRLLAQEVETLNLYPPIITRQS